MNTASSSQRLSSAPAAGDGSNRPGVAAPADLACDPDQATVISQRPPMAASGSSRPNVHAELARQLAGERLNHFQLLEYVGGGGMGSVFRALDTMLNREVALKVLSRDQGADDETRRRFQNEAQSAARLDHDHIARVYYVGEDRGLNYIVFEFIEGTNLRDLVEQKGPLCLAETLSYTLQMANALAHASSRDVVHRDIKPSNVIVTASGRAKLVDMGLARLHQVSPDGADLTASGVTLGTFDYISPEQARDPRSADVRSDIYSLGCTVYFMLTGRPPFPDGTVLQKLLQHNSDAPPDPREFDSSLPPAVSALVSKMLAKDPLRRYQLPSELVADLLSLAEQLGCALPGIDRPNWLAPPDTAASSASLVRHLPWLVPVSLLLVCVLAASWPLPWLDPPRDTELAFLKARAETRRPQPTTSHHDASTDDRLKAAADSKSPSTKDGRHSQKASALQTSDSSTEDESTGDPSIVADQASLPALEKGNVATVDDGREGPKAGSAHAETAGPENPKATASGPVIENSKPAAETTAPRSHDALAAEPIPEGLLIVGDGPKDSRRYNTLAAACAAAKNNDVIELRYDGPREEPPIVLNNQRIEIRAGAARRPEVVFRPTDANPAATDRTMISVSGGSLKLTGIEVALDLSQPAPSENWSLFSVDQVDNLRLDHCVLTVRNATASGDAYHDRVAFFSFGSGAGSEPMGMMPKGMSPLPPVQITLDNCFVRGEADLVADRDLKPLNFSCVNGLLALSERLFVAGEGASMPLEGSRIRINLDHVTALVRQGLCRVSASDSTPALPDVEVRLSGSEIVSDVSDAALVEHVSQASTNELQALFHWEATNTIYRGIRTFWKIATPGTSREIDAKSYAEWTDLWPSERNTRVEPLMWKLVPPRRPLDAVTAADFHREPGEGPESANKSLIGADPNLLPQTPAAGPAP